MHSPIHNLIATSELDTWSHSCVYLFALARSIYSGAILRQISHDKLHICRFRHFMVFLLPFIVVGSIKLHTSPNDENCWLVAMWFLLEKGVWIHPHFPGQLMHFTLNSTRGLEANLSFSRYTLVSDGLQCQMSRAFSFLIRLFILFLRLASGLLENHFLKTCW